MRKKELCHLKHKLDWVYTLVFLSFVGQTVYLWQCKRCKRWWSESKGVAEKRLHEEGKIVYDP